MGKSLRTFCFFIFLTEERIEKPIEQDAEKQRNAEEFRSEKKVLPVVYRIKQSFHNRLDPSLLGKGEISNPTELGSEI